MRDMNAFYLSDFISPISYRISLIISEIINISVYLLWCSLQNRHNLVDGIIHISVCLSACTFTHMEIHMIQNDMEELIIRLTKPRTPNRSWANDTPSIRRISRLDTLLSLNLTL